MTPHNTLNSRAQQFSVFLDLSAKFAAVASLLLIMVAALFFAGYFRVVGISAITFFSLSTILVLLLGIISDIIIVYFVVFVVFAFRSRLSQKKSRAANFIWPA